ncbi:T9SS type A sorting domain-containing protein [Cytophagaceae bacterium ABcell3]|nr:T9SS type A sorting domain-containing protein [Cytophagaceae bacterium ABcell3]
MKKLVLIIFSILLITPVFSQDTNDGEMAMKWEGGEQKFEMVLSPNPFEDQLNIKVTPGGKKITGIRIVDLIGKEVAWIDFSGGINNYTLDSSNIKPGIYFCSVYSDKGIIETKKLFRTK